MNIKSIYNENGKDLQELLDELIKRTSEQFYMSHPHMQ